MSDYLTNIAAKALNVMPVVQPRLASLYERSLGTGGPPAGHVLGVENAPSGRSSAEASLPPRSAPQHQGKGEGTPRERGPSRHRFAAIASPSEEDEAFASLRRSALLTPHTTEVEPMTHQRPLTPKLVQPPPAPTSTSIMHPMDERPSTDPHTDQFARDQRVEHAVRTSPQSGVETGRETALEQHSSSLLAESLATAPDIPSPSIGRRSESTPRSMPRAPIPVRAVAQPHEVPRREPDAFTVDDSTTTPVPAPVIRVSIGRVEVRAIMPPAAPAPRPKVARPGPGLSLEEYLKQEQRGQR